MAHEEDKVVTAFKESLGKIAAEVTEVVGSNKRLQEEIKRLMPNRPWAASVQGVVAIVNRVKRVALSSSSNQDSLLDSTNNDNTEYNKDFMQGLLQRRVVKRPSSTEDDDDDDDDDDDFSAAFEKQLIQRRIGGMMQAWLAVLNSEVSRPDQSKRKEGTETGCIYQFLMPEEKKDVRQKLTLDNPDDLKKLLDCFLLLSKEEQLETLQSFVQNLPPKVKSDFISAMSEPTNVRECSIKDLIVAFINTLFFLIGDDYRVGFSNSQALKEAMYPPGPSEELLEPDLATGQIKQDDQKKSSQEDGVDKDLFNRLFKKGHLLQQFLPLKQKEIGIIKPLFKAYAKEYMGKLDEKHMDMADVFNHCWLEQMENTENESFHSVLEQYITANEGSQSSTRDKVHLDNIVNKLAPRLTDKNKTQENREAIYELLLLYKTHLDSKRDSRAKKRIV
jgi:hypothetical protein